MVHCRRGRVDAHEHASLLVSSVIRDCVCSLCFSPSCACEFVVEFHPSVVTRKLLRTRSGHDVLAVSTPMSPRHMTTISASLRSEATDLPMTTAKKMLFKRMSDKSDAKTTTMSSRTYRAPTLEKAGEANQALTVLFGLDARRRRMWLMIKCGGHG